MTKGITKLFFKKNIKEEKEVKEKKGLEVITPDVESSCHGCIYLEKNKDGKKTCNKGEEYHQICSSENHKHRVAKEIKW